MRLLAALFLVLVPIAAPSEQVVISNGHVDLGPRFADGRWTIQLRDDTSAAPTWRPLDTVVLQATSRARIAVPNDPVYRFLGEPGQQIWVIPQVQQDGVVWPGWNTQDPEVARRVDREVTWTLEGVDGPGSFTLFLNSDFGKPAPVFDSRKPFPQETGIDVNTHVHGNWTFDAEGIYLLDVAMTAELTDGQHVTDRRTLRIYAGDGDARAAFALQDDRPRTEPDGVQLWWLFAGAGAVLLATAAVMVIRRRR
ncbi:choice-of-anchor M domain-containing protein [Kribbella sindirgiensis]|uniref:ABC transporter-associated repeat protein n=1 Tax=Kribbella sindirgiensis TaxID=1124744 RepID=A0A4R0HXX4_9ACTN|nr:choice-of-anchor M domain-containing protein [Kribbella sindirgiensis]TCC16742.1 hypothetical protein E0H50_40310 [Kribbella sindirgiensis]